MSVSFVLGDSLFVANSDECDGLFLKDSLMQSISSQGSFENIKPQYPFIEAQLCYKVFG